MLWSMAFTLEQLNKLKDAYAQGALKVRYGDKEVTYRSVSEMKQVIHDMEKALGLRKGVGITYPKIHRGTEQCDD
jgi:hypothetical protein